MAEGIKEAALTVNAPRTGVVLDTATGGTGFDGSRDHFIRVINEHFDSDGCRAEFFWIRKSVLYRFVPKERSSIDFQASH